MKVIIAGLPNTGSEAVELALIKLGYNVYGRHENMLQLAKDWGKLLNENGNIDDIREMYRGVDAVSSIPACYFWEEILQAYPDVKIIFTKLEDDEKWVEATVEDLNREHSDCDQIFLNMSSPAMCEINKRVVAPTERLVYGFSQPSLCSKIAINRSLLAKRYRAHNAHVMENAPKDQLLVFNPSDGWKPLCDFLGVATPSAIFPSAEDGKAAAKQRLEHNPIFAKAKSQQKITVSLFVILAAAGAFKIMKAPPALLGKASDWVQNAVTSVFKKS